MEDFAQRDKTKSYLFTTGGIYYRVNDMKLHWEHADRIIQIFHYQINATQNIFLFTDWREKNKSTIKLIMHSYSNR